jgi:hypothetical protein
MRQMSFYACFQSPNSGTIIITVFVMIGSLTTAIQLIGLLFSSGKPKRWWTNLRMQLGGTVFVSYFAFWITICQLALIGSGTSSDGFWAAVESLNYTRQWTTYCGLAGWLVLILFAAPRVFVTKLRKAGRSPMILQALPVIPVTTPLLAKESEPASKEESPVPAAADAAAVNDSAGTGQESAPEAQEMATLVSSETEPHE